MNAAKQTIHKITIRRCRDTGEYQVPTADDGKFDDEDLKTYFCDDKDDAIDTARFTFGEDVQIRWNYIN